MHRLPKLATSPRVLGVWLAAGAHHATQDVAVAQHLYVTLEASRVDAASSSVERMAPWPTEINEPATRLHDLRHLFASEAIAAG